MNFLIDCCFMIDLIERQNIPINILEDFRILLKTKSNWVHKIIGTKMKMEFLPMNPKNLQFYKWYNLATAGSKAIKKDFTTKIDLNDQLFDKNLIDFNFNFNNIMKPLKNKKILDDEHIIFAINELDINLLFTTDDRLKECIIDDNILLKLFGEIKLKYFITRKELYDENTNLQILFVND